jgi:hypothetical protein
LSSQPGVFVLQNDNSLVAMQPSQFAAETDFQALLTRFPALLVGDQIDPEDPRKFVLVNQEQSIGHSADQARFSVDHLFLDQDGIPTLVEVKRQSDTRLRREVVGQMLDYASNCQAFWTVDSIRESFEANCSKAGNESDAVLAELIGTSRSPDAFWSEVRTNLQAGKIRMLFVADHIPTELRRIVEFLNEQMDPAEILAIELRQFANQGLRTIVPMVFGQTQEAARKRSVSGARWTEERFLATVESKFPGAFAAVEEIYKWLASSGVPLIFGTGRENGSVYPLLRPSNVAINPVYLSTEGKIWLQFAPLIGKPVFNPIEMRTAIRDRFAEVTSSGLENADVNKYASLSFAAIAADAHGVEKVKRAWQWVIDQARA